MAKSLDNSDFTRSFHISSHDQGKPPPVYLKNGPTSIRQCTDLFCCLMFLVVTGGFCYFWTVAFLSGGDVLSITYPMDASGDICGVGEL